VGAVGKEKRNEKTEISPVMSSDTSHIGAVNQVPLCVLGTSSAPQAPQRTCEEVARKKRGHTGGKKTKNKEAPNKTGCILRFSGGKKIFNPGPGPKGRGRFWGGTHFPVVGQRGGGAARAKKAEPTPGARGGNPAGEEEHFFLFRGPKGGGARDVGGLAGDPAIFVSQFWRESRFASDRLDRPKQKKRVE